MLYLIYYRYHESLNNLTPVDVSEDFDKKGTSMREKNKSRIHHIKFKKMLFYVVIG